MMNSSYSDDADDFGANPFRSSRSNSGDGDLLGPNPTTNTLPNPATLDPVSGFSGQLDLPPSSQQQQQQQQQFQQQQQAFQQQQQYNNLSGAMNNNMNNNNMNNNMNMTGMNKNGNSINSAQYGSNASTDTSMNPFSRLPSWGSCMACLKLESYTQYFDVDTADVQARFKAALTTFWQPDQFRTAVLGERGNENDLHKGPDLYGPLWIAMTLIFLLAVTSNMSGYMHHRQQDSYDSAAAAAAAAAATNSTSSATGFHAPQDAFEYDLNHLVRAMTVVNSFVFGVPTFFWLAATCLGMPGVPLTLWICCYGYSMVPFAVATLLAWIPWEIVEWFVLASAAVSSALLVVRNLSTPLMQQDSSNHAKAAPLIMGIMGAHVCFLFVLKFTFYP
jgi:hypothetical protein